MALTRESEQRLRKGGLIQFFEEDRAPWIRMAQRTYRFLREDYPENVPVRSDDVAQSLVLILATNETLTARLDARKLTGKFWIKFFAELIVEREWNQIRGAN